MGFTTPPWGEQPLHRLTGKARRNLRDLSCLLLCSLRLNARAQNWHLYFLSGTCCGFAGLATGATDAVAVAAAGIANTIESSTRIPRVKRMGLSDPGARMTMDWTYAKQISFDHAFWCSVGGGGGGGGGEGSLGIGQVLSWLLV